MAFEQRATRDYFFTTLGSPAAISANTLTSTDFQGLDSDFTSATPGKYLPLVLHDPALGLYEVVWVTGHSSGSSDVTVVRGREGTVARGWNAGTLVESAPTMRDVLGAATSSTLPTDPHIGQRVQVKDKGYVVERAGGIWAPSAGVGLATDQKNNMHGVTPPDGAVLTVRCGTAGGTTDANGKLSCSYKNPFPNATLYIAITSTFINAGGNFAVGLVTASGADVYFLTNSSGGRVANTSASYMFMAVGW